MPLIIDGNNLLHTSMPPSLAGLDEARLARLLLRSPWHQQRMVVVLDGVPGPLSVTSPEPAVEFVWSGAKRSADDVIADLIAADSAPRRLVLVSSDHALQRIARRRRVQVMESAQFVSLLAGLPGEPAQGPDKPASMPPGEVDRWLREFGLDKSEKD